MNISQVFSLHVWLFFLVIFPWIFVLYPGYANLFKPIMQAVVNHYQPNCIVLQVRCERFLDIPLMLPLAPVVQWLNNAIQPGIHIYLLDKNCKKLLHYLVNRNCIFLMDNAIQLLLNHYTLFPFSVEQILWVVIDLVVLIWASKVMGKCVRTRPSLFQYYSYHIQ